jgi:hypothetical protein
MAPEPRVALLEVLAARDGETQHFVTARRA